ncbi:MAG: PASTA domain-containing protein [Acidobacteria bacterium]|nr:PASTA domain-containing protein [Acidobacteriota bacterium]
MTLRTRVWGAGQILFLGFALLVTYGVFFIASMGVAIRSRNVSVPNLAGQSLAQAEASLASVGLTASLDPLRRADLKVPADHVLTQEPSAGTTIRRGRAVKLRISEGATLPALPEVVGLTEQDAKARLQYAGITLTSIAEIQNGELNADRVVAQDPPARSMSGSAALLVNRSALGTTYVMPDLIGTPERRVTDFLRARGFRVAVVGYAAYPGLAGGVVIKQTPQAGFQIPPGETISLEVSR